MYVTIISVTIYDYIYSLGELLIHAWGKESAMQKHFYN